jgi:hypothetical protein
MSKSAESDASRINLLDSPDVLANKIKRAKTDGEHCCLPQKLSSLVVVFTYRSRSANCEIIYGEYLKYYWSMSLLKEPARHVGPVYLIFMQRLAHSLLN